MAAQDDKDMALKKFPNESFGNSERCHHFWKYFSIPKETLMYTSLGHIYSSQFLKLQIILYNLIVCVSMVYILFSPPLDYKF